MKIIIKAFVSIVVLIILVSGFYTKYKDLPSVKGAFNMVQLVVFAMVIAVVFQLVNVSQLMQLKSLLVVVISFTLFMCTKIHPALIIVGAGILGAVLK